MNKYIREKCSMRKITIPFFFILFNLSLMFNSCEESTKPNTETFSGMYFWRTYANKEIDYIEEKNSMLYATELKFSTKKNPPCPKDFLESYPNSVYSVANPETAWMSLYLPQ